MVNSSEIEELGIKHWDDIADDFKGADVLLGNGFSLRFSGLFHYNSLFEEFLQGCSPEESAVFSGFDTTNFEAIQEQLLNAKKVNQLLNISTNSIDPTVTKLREGLIESVNSNHPPASEIDLEELNKTAEDLDHFEDVFTLNYDLFLYRIIMICKERSEAGIVRKYNDYFWAEYGRNFKEFRDFDIYNNRYVYYLHGALFLLPGERFDYHNDLKLIRNEDPFSELLNDISKMIERGYLPLFVSEGESNDKMRFISESPYLSFAYRKLEESRRPLVIYGWSASKQDQHISNALSVKKEQDQSKRDLAISIHIGSKSYTALESELHAIRSRLAGHEITFFDSRTLFTSASI